MSPRWYAFSQLRPHPSWTRSAPIQASSLARHAHRCFVGLARSTLFDTDEPRDEVLRISEVDVVAREDCHRAESVRAVHRSSPRSAALTWHASLLQCVGPLRRELDMTNVSADWSVGSVEFTTRRGPLAGKVGEDEGPTVMYASSAEPSAHAVRLAPRGGVRHCADRSRVPIRWASRSLRRSSDPRAGRCEANEFVC
jgi:hypothetical protein